MNAHEIYEAQCRRDKQHHEERLEWLTEETPKYADGVPVDKIDVINWKAQSELCLAKPYIAYNTGPTED